MKKVLILAYDFPPYYSVGGLRPYSWYKYFKKFDFYPIVVTRQWDCKYGNHLDYISPGKSDNTIFETTDKGTIIQTVYKPNLANRLRLKYGEKKFRFLRKVVSGYFEFTQWILNVGPKKNLYFAAKDYLKNNTVDIILATGEPFVLFRYASKLSDKYNIPWIADYRDDWIDNHIKEINKNRFSKLLKLIDTKREKRYLSNCNGVTSVSKILIEQIAKRNNINEFEIVENGADLDKYIMKKNPYNKNDFVILYSGIFYDLPYLNDFFEGFDMFIKEIKYKENIKIFFIGIENQKNQSYSKVLKMQKLYPEYIIVEKSKSSEDIAQYQLFAHVLLNLIAGDPSKGLIGAKSYNYAVTRNPILTIPQIKERHSPFFPDRDIQTIALSPAEVRDFLLIHYEYFSENIRKNSSLTDEERFKLSREYNTKKLAAFIENLVLKT